MERCLQKATAFFDTPIDLRSRLVILLAALIIIPALFLPLWTMRFEAPRYPDGLGMKIYAHGLTGEKEMDLVEIDALNHYLGMEMVEDKNFAQFQWFPFLLGVAFMLGLRVIVLGKMSKLVDLFFLYSYSMLFTLWTFHGGLYSWGHNLNPYATVRIEPFMPPLWGHVTVGGVEMSAGPGPGVLFIMLVPVLLLIGMWMARRSWLRDRQPTRDYIS